MATAMPDQSGSPKKKKGKKIEPQQHHVSNILDEVLEESAEAVVGKHYRHPMILDVIIAVSLLLAAGAFTISIFKMYLVHSAEMNITQHNYKAAIVTLKRLPFSGLFIMSGSNPMADSDPDELLNQALYLDAMDKMENENDVNGALDEMQQIKAGSKYFALAQEIISENFQPSSTMLKIGVEKSGAAKAPPKKPFVPEVPKDATP